MTKRRWIVIRRWHVEADTVTDALDVAVPGKHDQVDVKARGAGPPVLAELYYTRDELEALQTAVGAALVLIEEQRPMAQSDLVSELLNKRWGLYNSLRTSLAEARWGLMTPEDIAQEELDLAEARAEGIVIE